MSSNSDVVPSPAVNIEEGIELRCPSCDYDLRALASGRCPECGLAIDRAALNRSQIPWTYRDRMGRFRAYWRTVWLAFRHPRRLAADVARPVSLADAQRFRHVTVLLAYVPMLAIAIWACIAADFELPFKQIPPAGARVGWALELAITLFIAGCLWLFLFAATGVASYFFHPRYLPTSRQNRAIALSYYAAAPLAWMPVVAVLLAAIVGAVGIGLDKVTAGEPVLILLACMLAGVLLLQGFSWWLGTLLLLRRTTGCGGFQVTALGAFLPLAWATLFVLILGFLPLALAYFSLVVLSVR